jgi:hypothetical protein
MCIATGKIGITVIAGCRANERKGLAEINGASALPVEYECMVDRSDIFVFLPAS